MIESAITTCSILDGKPVSYSPAHQMLRAIIGCSAAALTYEHEARLSHPPPLEVSFNDPVRNHSVAVGAPRGHIPLDDTGVLDPPRRAVSVKAYAVGS